MKNCWASAFTYIFLWIYTGETGMKDTCITNLILFQTITLAPIHRSPYVLDVESSRGDRGASQRATKERDQAIDQVAELRRRGRTREVGRDWQEVRVGTIEVAQIRVGWTSRDLSEHFHDDILQPFRLIGLVRSNRVTITNGKGLSRRKGEENRNTESDHTAMCQMCVYGMARALPHVEPILCTIRVTSIVLEVVVSLKVTFMKRK